MCVMDCLCRSLLSINLELTCVDCAGMCDAMRGWDRVKEVKQGEKKEHSKEYYADFFYPDPATL